MQPEIVYRLAVNEDGDAVLQFFHEHYFPDETLCRAYKPKERHPRLENIVLSSAGTSANKFILLAFNGNKIVGAFLCAAKASYENQLLVKENSQELDSSKSDTILGILAKIEKESNILERYNVTRVMVGNCLVVHKDFRGHRIGLKLFEKSMQLAKILDYELFISDCSSIYSARQAEFLGMECVNVFKIEDYRAKDSGEQVFFPPENQKYIRTYAKRIL